MLLERISCTSTGACWVTSVVSNSVQPHRRQPTRLPCLWDSPGKNIGMGCHFLLQCMKVKSESEVAQSCLTPSDPMDCSLPGSSVHGLFQARVLEWGAIAFSINWSLWKTKSLHFFSPVFGSQSLPSHLSLRAFFSHSLKQTPAAYLLINPAIKGFLYPFSVFPAESFFSSFFFLSLLVFSFFFNFYDEKF